MVPVLLVKWHERPLYVYAKDVDETLLCPQLTDPPLKSTIIEGYFRYRRAWIPVISAAHVLGEDNDEMGLYDVLLLCKSPRQWALRVHRVERVERVDWQAVQPSTGHKMPGLVGEFVHEDRIVSVFALPQVLLASEQEMLACADAIIQRREKRAAQAVSASPTELVE